MKRAGIRALAARAGVAVACAVVLGLGAGVLSGCQRAPRFVPQRADSTRASPDSLGIRMRETQRAWETAGPSEELAARTATMLRDALARDDAEDWARRARTLLDSLGIGAEIASSHCVMGVNLFGRAAPDAGSWPFLVWCGPDGPSVQSIEGRGLRLSLLSSRGLEPSARAEPAVAAVYMRRGASGFQPMLMVWTPDARGTEWKLAQTLGPDSLGGFGTAEFAEADTTVDLVLRTYQAQPWFDECPTCPHVFRVHRFRWEGTTFTRTGNQIVPSPYTSFVRFIHALRDNDDRLAYGLVGNFTLVEDARRLGWGWSRGQWRVAPGVEETPERMVFFHGDDEAWAVRFAPRGGDWVIAGFEPAERTIE